MMECYNSLLKENSWVGNSPTYFQGVDPLVELSVLFVEQPRKRGTSPLDRLLRRQPPCILTQVNTGDELLQPENGPHGLRLSPAPSPLTERDTGKWLWPWFMTTNVSPWMAFLTLWGAGMQYQFQGTPLVTAWLTPVPGQVPRRGQGGPLRETCVGHVACSATAHDIVSQTQEMATADQDVLPSLLLSYPEIKQWLVDCLKGMTCP